ncbi:zinc finger protein 185 isoform X2 [Eublepharis macularius]|uniref:Zinc finger protein 185 isoform X2 n=1 Tax=Eublepharis macularius TaxID=481883 RepID=A0AA97KA61_EUBMA|nr:zinc finger protein 185 isoform X2 [Eublepharis macularius]
MLSLSSVKDGVIVPSEEDRKKILTQMKVRTTLRSDKSWIQKKSDLEEEKNHSPLHSPVRSRKTSERSPTSPKVSPLNHRAVFEELSSQAEPQSPLANKPSKKSHNTTASSGYLIRGVFTKTIDKSAPSHTVPNGSQKSDKSASLPRSSSGYKMSTEDYKRLAPYNIKRDTISDHVDPPVSPDEQQKRTEAASSILRQTARKERSYVLSAAKKSNGVEIEDDTGPRSRSQTMPASSWSSSREKSTTGERRIVSGSPWSDQKISNAASTTSIDRGSRTQTSKHYSEYSSAFNHFTSLENSNKLDQEKLNLTSWDDSTPKVSGSPPKRSEKNGGRFLPTSNSEMQDSTFSEDRTSFRYRTGDAGHAAEAHHRSKTGEHLNDNGADSARYAPDHEEGSFSKEIKYESPSSRVTEDQPVTAKSHSFAKDSADTLNGERYSAATPVSNDQDIDPKRSFSGLEWKTTQEEAYESPSETDYKKVEARPANSGSWSSQGILSTAGTQIELPRAAQSEESELETASSLFSENSIATPESQQGEHGSDSDTGSLSRRATFGMLESNYRMPADLDHLACKRSALASGHRTSSYLDRPSYYTSRTSCGMPFYPSNQPYNTNMSEMNHRMASYLNNPAFGSGRSYSTSRDSQITSSLRSHRMPFYKDICDVETRRYLPGFEERAAFTSSISSTSSYLRNPSASGYESDPTTSSKGLLFVKESINSTELSSSPRCNSRSLVDLSTLERSNYSTGSCLQSSPPMRPSEDICTSCGREIRNCPKIKIEKLNICCHEFCFRCGICHKPMGDLLDKIFIHRDIVHCDKCYEKLF